MTTGIRFDDGAAYDRYMGVWSRAVGTRFLDWLAPAPGLRWLDVGCGNGTFMAQVAARCAPARLAGIDPAVAQLAYARALPMLRDAQLELADAMALPFADAAFDVAVMPLVLFFVPEPARGVAEMVRVVGPGGWVAAYAWDLQGQGFPYEGVRDALAEHGIEVPQPPSPTASNREVMDALWLAAGLQEVAHTVIEVQRAFVDWPDLWSTLLLAPSVGPLLRGLDEPTREALQARLQQRFVPTADGSIVLTGRARAIRGQVIAN